MMTNEKIWKEVEYFNPVFNEDAYEWAINYGVKVMRMKDDGALAFRNTRIGGDFYGPITTNQKNYIYLFGFSIGAMLVGLETMMVQLKRANRLIRNNQNKETALNRFLIHRSEIMENIHHYTSEIKILAKRLPDSGLLDNILKQIIEQ